MTTAVVGIPSPGLSISVDRAEALAEIHAARSKLKDGEAVFVGINNNGLHSDGSRTIGEPLFRTFDGDAWQRELMIYAAADLRVKCIEPYKGEITQAVVIPELDDEPLEVRYYGLELKNDGVWGSGSDVKDPRAHIVPGLLTDTEIVWPFVYVYAEIRSMMTAGADDSVNSLAKPLCATPADEAARVLATGLLRDWNSRKAMDVTDNIGEGNNVEWSTPGAGATPPSCAFGVQAEHWDVGSPDPSARPPPISDVMTAEALQIDAKQAAASGDHKAAYLLMEKAISLTCAAEARKACTVPTAHEMEYAPAREEAADPPSGQSLVPRSFKPATTYDLADGTTHVIAAGLYTDDEFFAKTIEAQDMADAAQRSADRARQAASMNKYAGPPLERSDSQLDKIASIESLGSQIKQQAERARTIMETSLSKEASPTIAPSPAPDLPASSELVKLGDSLADVRIDSESQQAKWDNAGDKLAAQAAAIWGPK